MFCTAFYSYKGGVGRTLALANVAVVLAKKNRRVLVVDFDLEAPGLTTLAAFRDAAERRGLVDFVQEYLKTGEVPSVAEYIQKCEVIDPQTTLTLEIHVMPAGRLDDGYPQRFAAIDWAKLYEVQDGFLLMEDLRVQWAAAGYDYVLIDSRTGLTDIGGICTRQLPDVVVAVFFPNEQNLAGLKQVVPSIREQGARPRPIDVLFAASRVPRLDDEHGVLRTWLAKFRSELSYDETRLTIIEHYDSLSLLDQTLFVLDRPNSGLAHQYEELAAAISQQNVEDADGVLRFLHDARAQLQDNLARRTPPQQTAGVGQPEEEALLKRMEAISKFHQRDYVVQWALAQVYHQLRRLVDAAIATDQALSAVDYTRTTDPVPRRIIPSIHRLRIRIFNELGDMDEVAQSAEQVLNDPGASDLMALDALLALSSADPSRLPHPDKLPALDGADRDRLIAVARRLSASPPASQIAAAIAERALYADGGVEELSEEDMHHLQLVLLAGGRVAANGTAAHCACRHLPLATAIDHRRCLACAVVVDANR